MLNGLEHGRNLNMLGQLSAATDFAICVGMTKGNWSYTPRNFLRRATREAVSRK